MRCYGICVQTNAAIPAKFDVSNTTIVKAYLHKKGITTFVSFGKPFYLANQ
eukprot:m.311544 g.311544  ORF g.311544 m.311544 type:complete len:51 (+) comp433688_c0_seq1:178-330(+)